MNTVKDPNRTPEEEISRLAEKYQLSLLRLCFAYLHDRTLAEDAVQETCIIRLCFYTCFEQPGTTN